jgi:hypothetical protein
MIPIDCYKDCIHVTGLLSSFRRAKVVHFSSVGQLLLSFRELWRGPGRLTGTEGPGHLRKDQVGDLPEEPHHYLLEGRDLQRNPQGGTGKGVDLQGGTEETLDLQSEVVSEADLPGGTAEIQGHQSETGRAVLHGGFGVIGPGHP